MESTNELVTAAEARAEGLSLDGGRLFIGTNQNIPLQGLLAVMCINNT